tara:strand:- start:292 stop:549 length:258 start_codon:yes stop_codon:yes gene_type:complete
MLKKKSYMNNSNLIKEGFFNKISKFLKDRPKVKGKEKLGILKTIKLALGVSGINKELNHLDKLLKKRFGDDYPDLPKFTADDFVR